MMDASARRAVRVGGVERRSIGVDFLDGEAANLSLCLPAQKRQAGDQGNERADAARVTLADHFGDSFGVSTSSTGQMGACTRIVWPGTPGTRM